MSHLSKVKEQERAERRLNVLTAQLIDGSTYCRDMHAGSARNQKDGVFSELERERGLEQSKDQGSKQWKQHHGGHVRMVDSDRGRGVRHDVLTHDHLTHAALTHESHPYSAHPSRLQGYNPGTHRLQGLF
jgi:molybdate-binding protein